MTGWLTVLLGTVAVAIALAQWLVARQKFVLDLFDRRHRAYTDVVTAVRPAIVSLRMTDEERRNLRAAIENSKFLFGSDVNDYLQVLWKVVVRLDYWNNIYGTDHPDAGAAPEALERAALKIGDFFTEYPALCAPYMMMPEKRVRTPIGGLTTAMRCARATATNLAPSIYQSSEHPAFPRVTACVLTIACAVSGCTDKTRGAPFGGMQ